MNLELWRKWLRPFSDAFRELAFAGEERVDTLAAIFADPFFAALRHFKMPPKYWQGIKLSDGSVFYGTTSLENVCFAEELAYGDPGLYLALPGPNLAGTVVNQLGTEEQKDQFFHHYLQHVAWSAFALTEPDAGSDAAAISTTAVPQQDGTFLLNGSKRYIGSGAHADWYVVFARTRPVKQRMPSLLGMEAFLFKADENRHSLTRTTDQTIGLRAARLGRISFCNLQLNAQHVLGYHRKPLMRGFLGALSTFQFMRPVTAAMAVGLARAAIAYTESAKRLTAHEEIALARLKWQVKRGRLLAMQAAILCDRGSLEARHYASLAKLYMNRLAVETTRTCCAILGPEVAANHPYLDKLQRDSWMVEYMEGTSNVLTIGVHTGLLADGTLPLVSRTGGGGE
ncbi:MAG: acyl-CoA dehydrogenase family protein [Brevibacillus sp.]|nr:acyl-CoA dehydrogenase family protein [Brevibacillus sp.]